MGASQSSPTHVTHDYNITPPKRGLHVLRVAPYSPAAQTDLEPFFDFVVGLDAESNTEGDEVDDLADVVAKHEGRPLGLVIWSSKSRTVRLTQIIPSREWSSVAGAASTSTNAPPLLGLTMRACNPSHSLEAVWHVLDVADDSPAESAGLVPRGDWVVGWSGGPLAKEQDFYDVVESHEGKPLRIFIYSYDFDTLREVVVVPNRQWGGAGLLGCELGYGLLHRIPEAPSTLFSAKDLGDVEEDMYSSRSVC
ncbi:GRASP55/65 PDZ-like domain-containing protein [Auriculariales sp. MPI-PUGE-AT-0066]|nr:GRASP55/65 PDZ-like domain-containing protein [Auriculariales sp. MPI-PUGE-AT-0066]